MDEAQLLAALERSLGPRTEPLCAWAAQTAAASADLGSGEMELEPFVKHLAHLAAGKADALVRLQGAELALAWACARRLRSALDRLDRAYLSRLRPLIRRTVGSESATDDVLQQLRERLLVAGPDLSPRIASYAGQGPLIAWLRAAAARVALNSQRAPLREVQDEAALQQAAVAHDLEAEILRGRHKATFEAAFRESLAGLMPRQRTLLRLHFEDGLALERIAALHGTHKSTISRWLAAARGELLQGIRARLAERLGLDPDQVRSLVRALNSRVSLGLSALSDGEG